MQSALLEAGFAAAGFRTEALPEPDAAALATGKEFGNRAQCNPTYYTVGNLVKHLISLRDERGLTAAEIEARFALLTSGSCGPCRFGLYRTEYRKALRDAGFPNFRVIAFIPQHGVQQICGEGEVRFGAAFFAHFVACCILGDVLNLLGYRLRPYEVVPGATDAALAACRALLAPAIAARRRLTPVLLRCRRILAQVRVDRLRPKPKVAVIGEFWAMTTEGEGNYRLHRFLEAEGAECVAQPITNWFLYLNWVGAYDEAARYAAAGERGLAARWRHVRAVAISAVARAYLSGTFHCFATLLGLTRYHLGNMRELAALAKPFYHNELRGGEGHMEVAKRIDMALRRKVHLTISVKPFGCMPSSAVSDGVQALVSARYPEAAFLAMETSGEGEVNALSRVQMALFRAKAEARAEFAEALAAHGVADVAGLPEPTRAGRTVTAPLHAPRHRWACTAANCLLDL
jgi:predicted nucleotide-binding protein (sugar kinase/HSP70/actin superfamily)